MFRTPFMICFAVCGLLLTARGQQRDTIVLYNGQVLIGTVQSAIMGSISIDDMDMKIINIKLYKIRILKIKEPFKIETIGKKILYGTLNTTGREGWVEIHTESDSTESMPVTNIFQLTSLTRNLWKRMNGNISAGLSFTKSNNIGQVNFSAMVQLSSKLFNYQLSFVGIGSIDSGRFSRDNENLLFLTTYELTNSWFLVGGGQYQRNLELSLNHRYLGILGFGNKLFIRNNWRLQASSGITFSQEKSTANIYSGLLLDIPLMFQFNFYQFHHPDIQISSTQTLYFSMSEAGRTRWDGSTSFSWQLIRYFYLTISPYTNFDSKPPGNGSQFDYGLVVGISYKF